MVLLHILPTVVLAVVVTIGAGSLTTGKLDAPKPPTTAELAYADAPHGVDPMVTGPVSASFKKQQEIEGCDQAKWPDIPLACFPE